MSVQPAALEPLRAGPRQAAAGPSRAAARRCPRSRAFVRQKPLGAFGAALVMLFLVLAVGAQWLAPYPYDVGVAAESPAGAVAGPSVRHRRQRPRPAQPDHLGRAHLGHDRLRRGADQHVSRRGRGRDLGLLRRLVRPVRAAPGRHLDLVPGAGAAGQPDGDRRSGLVEHDAGPGDAARAGRPRAWCAARRSAMRHPAVHRVGALPGAGDFAHRAQLRPAQRLGTDPGRWRRRSSARRSWRSRRSAFWATASRRRFRRGARC